MGPISILVLMLCSCSREPTSLEDYLPLLGDWEQFDASIQALEPMERDLLLLRLAVQQPRYSITLCQKVQSTNAKEKCKQVIGRPHLTIPRPK